MGECSLPLLAGTNLIAYEMFIHVVTGTPTTANVIYYSTMSNIGASYTATKHDGGELAITGLSMAIIQPQFWIRSTAIASSWTAQRREYSFTRIS